MSEQEAYVGSEACATCHPQIFQRWRTTRHSYSILTAAEAQQAGFPLPQARPGAETPAIRSWQDVSYVVGGRQRITYVDQHGQVQDTSYHHRLGTWDSFPAKQMTDCGPCHFTGFGAGEPHPDNPVVPGRWAELNIGCESCHGPGARHAESLDAADIVVDVSSRQCGTCHTAVGRVLPLDDRHSTHDLIQVWHDDRHATGVRRYSHNAFCSRCHSPYQGAFYISRQSAMNQRVFAEAKQTITCIACHNPHDLTHAHYRRSAVSLRPPLPPKLHTYQGNDVDIDTLDFKTVQSTERVCVQCHRGPDRIELDHAGATCTDCHNTFHRHRGAASRVVHDANRRDLTCRTCHQDADHLMTLLYRDPDFLQPAYIHNLRTLPAAVTAKYGLRYAQHAPLNPAVLRTTIGIRPTATNGYAQDQSARPTAPVEAEPVHRAQLQPDRSAREAVHHLLAQDPHQRLALDAQVQAHQSSLRRTPGSITATLDLALVYVRRQAFAAAREILEFAIRQDSHTILQQLSGQGRSTRERQQLFRKLQALASGLQPLLHQPHSISLRLWLQGYLAIASGRLDDAAASFTQALWAEPQNASFLFYHGAVRLLQQRPQEAIASLERAIAIPTGHRGARIVLAQVYLQQRQRLSRAQKLLQEAIAQDADDAEVHAILGRVYVRRGMIEAATRAFRTAIALEPDDLRVRYDLAQAYRLGNHFDDALKVYDTIIQRRPDDFEAHYRAGKLLKYQSDRFAFQLLGEQESAASPGLPARQWHRSLADLQRQSHDYGQRALSAFEAARHLRPLHPDIVRQVCNLYRRFERLSEALACFTQLTQWQPTNWLAHYRLGTLLIQLEAYDDAKRRLQQALRLAPTKGDTYLALSLAELRRGRVDEAIATLEQGRLHEAFNPALYTNLGAAYAMRGRYRLARKALERSLALATFPLPRLHLTYTNLALVHWHQGRHDQAVQALKNALYVFPTYAYARRLLAGMQSQPPHVASDDTQSFVVNDRLERFGVVTTVAFGNE